MQLRLASKLASLRILSPFGERAGVRGLATRES